MAGTSRRGATKAGATSPAATAEAIRASEPADADAAGVAPEDDAPGATGAPTDKGRPPRRRPPWWVVVAALLVAVVAVAAAIGVALRPGDDAVRESALTAARTYTTSLTTYDYRALDADFARVKKVATGDFAAEYDKTSGELRPSLVSNQAVATSTVVGAGIERLQGEEATVLVAVNQQITTSAAPTPRGEANRLRMVLVRQNGNWLVSKVERL